MLLAKLGFEKSSDRYIHSSEISALTSLRFFASVYVCIFHVLLYSRLDANGFFNNFFSSGYMAVDFFFVLSGFILSYNYAGSVMDKTFSYRRYMVRRVARIYPVHLITLIVIALIAVLLPSIISVGAVFEDQSFSNFFKNLFLVHAWYGGDEFSFNKPSWSISSEFFVYIFFPLFIWLWRYVPSVYYLALSVFLLSVLYFLFLFFSDYKITTLPVGSTIFRVVPDFLYGAALYMFFSDYRCKLDVKRCLLVTTLLIAACCFIFNLDLIVMLASGFVILLVSEMDRQNIKTWLSHPVLVYLGKVSFSLYMVHYIVWTLYFLTLRESFDRIVASNETLLFFSYYILASLIIAVSLFFACILHHLAEKPMRKLIVSKVKFG